MQKIPVIVAVFIVLTAGSATADGMDIDPMATAFIADVNGVVSEQIEGLTLVGAFKRDYGFRLIFTRDRGVPTGDNLVEFVMTVRDDAAPAVYRTSSFNVLFKGPTVGGRPAPELAKFADEVFERMGRNDDGKTVLARAPPAEQPGWGSVWWPPFNKLMALLGIVLVLFGTLTTPFVATKLWRDIEGRTGRLVWLVLAIGLVGVAVRLALPHRPVMYYMGYRLVEMANSMEVIPKYGPGSLALYHLLFKITGPSHAAMMYVNSVIGGLLPFAAAGLLSRLVAGRVAPIVATFLLALTPLFIKDSTTESLLVPMMTWFVLGLWLLARARKTRSNLDLANGFFWAYMAVISRPESVVLVPLTILLLLPLSPLGEKKLPHWSLKALWIVALVLWALRAAHLSIAVFLELNLGNNPILTDPVGMLKLVEHLWDRNIALMPDLFPSAIVVMAFVPVIFGSWKNRIRAVAFILVSLAWILVSFLDLPYVSIPRVQVPGMVFLTLSAVIGLSALFEYRLEWLTYDGLRTAFRWILVVATGVAMAISAGRLWERTNADDEDDLINSAIAVLPDTSVTFVRRAYADRPVERIHLFYPDYLFAPPHRNDVVVGPTKFSRMDDSSRPAYFLLGTRCYTRHCGEREMHPACRALLDQYKMTPVIEREVPIRRLETGRTGDPDSDLDFPWCLTERDTMKLGLYRIDGAI